MGYKRWSSREPVSYWRFIVTQSAWVMARRTTKNFGSFSQWEGRYGAPRDVAGDVGTAPADLAVSGTPNRCPQATMAFTVLIEGHRVCSSNHGHSQGQYKPPPVMHEARRSPGLRVESPHAAEANAINIATVRVVSKRATRLGNPVGQMSTRVSGLICASS